MPVFTDLTDGDLRSLIDREATAAPLTFGEMCRLYAVHFLKQRRARVEVERIYKNLLQSWASRPLAEITRKDVRLWYMGFSHTPSQANKALSFVRRIYNVAAYHLEVYEGLNPATKMPRYPTEPRERFLSQEEAQRFMEGLPHLPPKPGAYFLILLLTGARLTEVRCMRWADIEWTTRLWRKPKTKNGSSQCVPLPVQVMDALARLPRNSEWIFPGTHGRCWCAANPQKLWGLIRRRWNMLGVTIHNLRRTCASHLAMAGENLPTIQNVLNHKTLAHTAIYARLNTKAVDRALQTQADRLCSMTAGVEVLPALMHDPRPAN
jgi:integrase